MSTDSAGSASPRKLNRQGRLVAVATCQWCEKRFHPRPENKGMFCSRQCAGKAQPAAFVEKNPPAPLSASNPTERAKARAKLDAAIAKLQKEMDTLK